MVKAYILQIAMAGIIVVATPVYSVLGAADSNKVETSFKSRDEFTAQINGKELKLWKGLKLSETFETLGDPEDIGEIYTDSKIYGWGLDCLTGECVVIDAQPKKNEVIDWMVMKFNEGKISETLAYSVPGKIRSKLAQELKEMRESRKSGKPQCPGGLWCSVINNSQYGRSTQKYEILDKYDVVGPAITMLLRNEGPTSIKTPENLADEVFLTIKTPDGQQYISRLSKIGKSVPEFFKIDERFYISIPFFCWVTDSNKPIDVPVGIYQCYGTILGSHSRTISVDVHRQAFAITSPNVEDEEIVIKPYYNKLPIQGFSYDDLVTECKAVFKKKFEGDPNKVLIPANRARVGGMTISGGPHVAVIYEMPGFPLSDFAEVKIRKKDKNGVK